MLVLIAFVVLVYVSSYVVLSRRGFAEADAQDAEGFYFLAPEDSDEWRFRNFTLVRVYAPLIAVDNAIGTGRGAASEPLWDLE